MVEQVERLAACGEHDAAAQALQALRAADRSRDWALFLADDAPPVVMSRPVDGGEWT